jgi:hypothetical protein
VIVSAHQPDLLPYSGFFYKMAKSDAMDLKVFDQYVHRGYQRRVKMQDQWATIPVIKDSPYDPINTVRVDPDVVPAHLAQVIEKRYSAEPYWKVHGQTICDFVLANRTEFLWQFNFNLILLVRDLLGIKTPVAVTGPPTAGKGAVGLCSVIERYRSDGRLVYLSGTGAKAYMGDCSEFTAAGIEVVFSPHKAVTGDSILSLLMRFEDPLSYVLAEETA